MRSTEHLLCRELFNMGIHSMGIPLVVLGKAVSKQLFEVKPVCSLKF